MSDLPRELVGEFIDAVVRDPTRADAMLAQRAELLNARWIHGETVLHFLAIEGFAKAVRFMTSHGADVNAVNEFGDSALVDVASLGLAEIADILLSYGADPDASSPTYDNPLHAATRSGHVDVVGRLLKAGADARYRTDLGESVFNAVEEAPTARRQALLAVLAEHGVREPSAD